MGKGLIPRGNMREFWGILYSDCGVGYMTLSIYQNGTVYLKEYILLYVNEKQPGCEGKPKWNTNYY